jgi:hypothetical protein
MRCLLASGARDCQPYIFFSFGIEIGLILFTKRRVNFNVPDSQENSLRFPFYFCQS